MPLRHKCHSTYLKRNHQMQNTTFQTHKIVFQFIRAFCLSNLLSWELWEIGCQFFNFATYWGPQIHISLHSSFVLIVFVRRIMKMWMKIDLKSALLLGLGSNRISSHRRISPKVSMAFSYTINEDLLNILVFRLPYEGK